MGVNIARGFFFYLLAAWNSCYTREHPQPSGSRETLRSGHRDTNISAEREKHFLFCEVTPRQVIVDTK